jgi:indole-3-glycerol phosphate synthase
LIDGWQAIGATHLSLLTTNCGFSGATEHLNAIRHFAEFLHH